MSTVWSFDTELPADCAEFCPVENYRSLLAVGTYAVHRESEDTQMQRSGRIYLVDTAAEAPSVSSVDCSAVLDVKWHRSLPLLFAADSLSNVSLYDVSRKELKDVASVALDDTKSSLNLSLDLSRVEGDRLAVSCSDGRLAVVRSTADALVEELSWMAHSLEAWCCSWDPFDVNMCYSGADDCLMKVWDTRSTSCKTVKGHDAGVVSIVPHPIDSSLLVTGSYDEYVRVWDKRCMKTPLTSYRTEGGGCWKLKWHPRHTNVLGVAAMHAGFHLLTLDESKAFSLLGSYTRHTSLAYGIDFSFENDLVASCSFYDHCLTLWSPKSYAY